MKIDIRLENDSTFITNIHLCQVRLHKNAAFPWVILIPMRENWTELVDLPSCDQVLLMQEIALVSRVMKTCFNPYKLNVANLGNIVPQLHIHVVARFQEDAAWPGPVWGHPAKSEYKTQQLKDTTDTLMHLITKEKGHSTP